MKGLVSLFIFILLLQLATAYYSQQFLLTDELYRLLFGKQMNDHQFNDFCSLLKNGNGLAMFSYLL
jgi:hypothetical protein